MPSVLLTKQNKSPFQPLFASEPLGLKHDAMKTFTWLACALLLLGISCSRNEPIPFAENLIGNWRLYEVGSSPGFGYNITSVPATPLQRLTFSATGEVSGQGADIPSFFNYPYYRVDTVQAQKQLVFLQRQGEGGGYSVHYAVQGDKLRISPTCYEGCHYAFVRIP